jgi:hypothetical protein
MRILSKPEKIYLQNTKPALIIKDNIIAILFWVSVLSLRGIAVKSLFMSFDYLTAAVRGKLLC